MIESSCREALIEPLIQAVLERHEELIESF
jgi:hypothetical protein